MATRKDLGPVSAYAIAVANGFTGTEAEWTSLIANASNSAQEAAESAGEAAQSAQETADLVEDARTQYGSPLKAATVAEMTDTAHIYVYVGSETGYTAGNWYYHNGSAWVSGGVYNSAGINTDKTLSVEDMAADGKAVGEELTALKADFNDFSGVDGISGQSINGSANIETPITETITQNNYWYATGSRTIANGGAIEGIDKAVFDITNMSGKIAIGFDPNASYGSGSMVVGLSSSAVSPYTRVTYYSVSNVQNNPNYFTVNGNVVTIDLDALKSAYPTAVLMFVNVPHDVWKLDNITTFKKTLYWLSIDGYVPSIIVASDGSGDYTTISDAVTNANNGDTIYIKDGEYKETVVVNKYVHLVGQSKQNTVLYQDIGDYNNCPLLITQGSVCNMTIKSLAPDDTSGLSSYAYAIHLDKNFASEAKYQKCEIYNCDIYSEVNDAIGAGTNYASEYNIHDCLLHVAHNPVKAGACGFKCHNGQNQTTGKVTLRNNVIMTEDANGTSRYDILFHNGGISNTQPIDIILVGNVLKHYHNRITNIFVPSDYNYGNSVAEMNTLS